MMTVQEIIKKYGITLAGSEYIRAERSRVKSQNDVEIITSNKPEILAFLLAEKEQAVKAARERREKINAIEGLNELYAAINEWDKFFELREKAWEIGEGIFPSKPSVTVEEVKAKYPRASAYIKAEGYENSANYDKASAGKRAKERIINGEDYEKVIADMDEEWSKAAMSHIWD